MKTRKMINFRRAYLPDVTIKEAAEVAGMSTTGGRTYELARQIDAEIAAAALEQATAWGGSSALAPVINRMRDVAFCDEVTKSAAAMREARELLVEIARLKALLPKTPTADVRAPGLTDSEWLAKYGPKG